MLRDRGYCVVGPTRRDGAIVYEEIASADELPAGWTEVQEAATYRLERRDDEARFGYPVGPHSWKRWLLPARVRLWQARRGDGGTTEFVEEPPPERPFAFLGVRSCDLHAIAIQDRVFLEGAYVDRDYAGPPRGRVPRRRQLRRRPAAPASAPRWAPARAPRAASTSRSPSCSTASTASSSRSGSDRGAEVLADLLAGAGGTRTTSTPRSASPTRRSR